MAPRNTIGDVPLEWYKDETHIGYDLAGKKIKKKERQDKLDSFLASADDSKNWLVYLSYLFSFSWWFDRNRSVTLFPWKYS